MCNTITDFYFQPDAGDSLYELTPVTLGSNQESQSCWRRMYLKQQVACFIKYSDIIIICNNYSYVLC